MPRNRDEAVTLAETRMANYSQVFADTIAEFVSPYVPGDRGDEGKGQVTARAGYKIHLSNPSMGYIGKTGGQTQYHGIAVDAIQDCSDGYGADYLTDELQPDGSRLIRVAYTAYPTPSVPPNHNWVKPTTAYLEYGGPLVLKSDTPPPEPEPEPVPDDATQAKLDQIIAMQAVQSDQIAQLLETTAQTQADLVSLDTFIRGTFDQIEDWLNKFGKLLVWWRQRNDDETQRGVPS